MFGPRLMPETRRSGFRGKRLLTASSTLSVGVPATADLLFTARRVDANEALRIGLVNEVALMCHRLDLDTWEVIDAAATKPFGFMPFYPGPGLGGHCIPVDPHYLSWKLKTLNYQARFIEMAGEIIKSFGVIGLERTMNMYNNK